MSRHGLGTIRTVKDRVTGEVVGYQALLPRERSQPPPGCRNPLGYKQPLGPRQPTREAARSLLNAAILEMRAAPTLRHGLPLAHYVSAAIKAKAHASRRAGASAGQVATWRSIESRWLPESQFIDWPPPTIDIADVQSWIDRLRDDAESVKGEPLSSSFVRQVNSLLVAAFERAKVQPNPATLVKLPPKDSPKVPHLDLAAQRRLFGADSIPLADRVMAGCGMGAGLRVGELLSIEIDDARVDDHDPHLIVRYGGPGRSPTKGRRIRRVELFDPGLGFWRRWLADHYRGGQLVFGGPKGGYQKHWPELFPNWASAAKVDRLSSHVMRHTYAVSTLSGSWGYEPRSLEFVSQQLGHADRSTTERYYGAFDVGVWQREVRHMTGRETMVRVAAVADELLGQDERWNSDE
jgi:integrase